MSSLTKSLEKRIQELTSSIDAQKTQLIAYEGVLALEMAKDNAPHEATSEVAETHLRAVSSKKEPSSQVMTSLTAAPDLSDLEFTGNKTNLVAALVNKFGSGGATPKDLDAIFTGRDVPRSKNLIYNTLSYLVARKRLVRKEGRYFALGTAAKKSAKKAVKKYAKKAAKKTAKKTTTPRRKMSAEGIERIRQANQKRWANKRAADAAAAAAPKKKVGRPAKKQAAQD